jgi:hypothetical protein
LKEIQLTQGKVTLVDDEDFEFLNAFKWCAHRAHRTFYAERGVRRADGRWAAEQMHRIVLARKLGRDIVSGMQCDHENGNGLDNRRENLQELTNRGNTEKKLVTKTSCYLGVSWHKPAKKWSAKISVNHKKLYLGIHTSELEAALAREAFIDARPELMARTNFPPTLWDM